jgi:cytochrome c biogenesis protein CcmG, thiol:disulfide interchange protein DsbE
MGGHGGNPGQPDGPRPGPAGPPGAAGESGVPGGGPAAGWAGRLRGVSRARLATISAAVVAVIVGLSVAGATVASGHPAARPPTPAKNFTLSVLGHPGRHLSLSSLAGKPVIVNFFASWCIPCQRETPLIAGFYRASRGHPAVIGVDVNDSAANAQAFVRKKGVRYPVVVDPAPMTTALAYGLPGLPATFFLNSRHQIVKRVFGALTRAELTAGSKLMSQQGK